MSADPSQITLESLQCHFTWDLNRSWSKLLLIRDKLLDTGSEEGNRWGGHIYNLRGFIQFKLGQHEDAVTLFEEAAEVFQRVRGEDQGPWLVVNYGNLAWLHHLLGDQEQSQVYLSKVGALMEEHPPEGELHAEVCAEKAWTLMYLRGDVELAADLFQRAVSLQPEMVEWNSSHVLSLVRVQERRGAEVTPDLLEKMRQAKDQDPENLYLAALYLKQCAKRGESVGDEVHKIARKVLETPVGSYNCLRTLLRVYKNHLSIDEYIDLAEEALKKHPGLRYLKTCLASGYIYKIYRLRSQGRRPNPGMIDRAISLQEEVASLYPHSPLMKKVNLADLYAKSGSHQAKAEQIFEELLHINLEPADKQLLYNTYAKYLTFDRNELGRSIHFHMKAAEIPEKSYFRERSIVFLEKMKNKGKMCREIEEFLENLREPGAENEA